MSNPVRRNTGYRIQRIGMHAVRSLEAGRLNDHRLADHQETTPYPNDTGKPVTPTQHAPGAAWTDLNALQGGAPCLDEEVVPDI